MSDTKLGQDKRGPRGHRGERGHRGPAGPTGPTIINFTPSPDGPGRLIADEDIPAGFVIAAGGSARLALANGTELGNAIGVSTTTVVAAQATEYSLIAGLLSLVTAVWDSSTGQSGGLTEGATYYLSQVTPGKMTSTKPTSGQVVQIGVAISTTTMALGCAPQSTAGTAVSSTEHVAFAAGTAVADPTKDVTFVDDTGGAHGNVTLADGPSDGFEKTILTTFLADGNVTITPANGQQYTISAGFAGSVTYRWDAVTTHAWYAVALVNAA